VTHTDHHDWRRHGAFYQIYPRSFADGDGDGTGDIAGIRSHLDHVGRLGVDGIWVNPWYDSPFRDGGYDISDHRSIHARFGTIDDAGCLFADAASHGLRVLIDLVPNHTSDQHPWFRAALAAPAGAPERDRYHFRPGRGEHGELPPSDWESAFGGSAWTRTDAGDWYLHLFDGSQPDLNWSDPTLRTEFEDILRFWIELGASGARVDAVQGLGKDPTYPDWRGRPGDHVVPSGMVHPYRDRPENHDIVRGWRRVVDSYTDRELMLIGETIVAPWERLGAYLRPDEFHQVFDFEFLETPWDGDRLRAHIELALATTTPHGALPTWVWSNHDIVRPATRFGLPPETEPAAWLLDGDRHLLDADLGLRRSRAAAMLAMALPGAYFCFQGEELGLPEVHDLPVEALDDPIYERSGRTLKGRDGCRVPIPWTVEGPSSGFGTGGSWLPQPAGWGVRSVGAQQCVAGSTLSLFQQCLRLRREHLCHDRFEWLDRPGAIAFRRGDVTSITNFAERSIPLPSGTVLAASGPITGGVLEPATTAWIAPGEVSSTRPR